MGDFKKTCLDFEQFLQDFTIDIKGFHPHFKQAFWEMLRNGGKRFRPNLLLGVVCALRPMMIKNAFLPALAIECLHTYSLIHDDLPCMDNASLRRNHPTLHTSYDETTAVLVGDGLNTFAFALLANALLPDNAKIRLISELANNGGIEGMIIGQAMDCYFENKHLSLEQIQTIHSLKTARLIAASLKMGGIVANANEELIDELGKFGERLGIFFQIRDDVIDVVLDSTQAGKTTQNDGAKNSYVNLLGLEGAKKMLEGYKKELLDDLDNLPKPIAQNLNELLILFFKDI